MDIFDVLALIGGLCLFLRGKFAGYADINGVAGAAFDGLYYGFCGWFGTFP